MAGFRVEAIANEFIRRARDENKALTNMQLQKLPYIAHGWGLVVLNDELISQEPKAWPYGPVYPTLYEALSRYGSSKVSDFIHENDGNVFAEERGPVVTCTLSEQEKKLLDVVWKSYKNYHAYQLSALTHQDDSPWTITTRERGPYASIENSLIRKHFSDLAAKRRRKDS